ncbi:MAG: phosphoglucosamine mutase [Bdellovibrionaceae bacterium]|nr:phosphoglucosamine mutase [Bdellovibrionales bacterium]MCB9083919.1 phosphoglucosamine mutase [Pseudobdellovibrionaceae bacterium]
MSLFGTDGIRGTANRFPMTPDIVLRVGQALGYVLRQQPSSRRVKHRMVMIGKDTRLSGYMVEQALSAGLNSMGVWTQLVGPLPTPGIGFLARNMRADAGVVISASHNAYFDNGIKIFGADGFKISGEMEKEIERLVRDVDLNSHLADGNAIGRAKRIDDAAGRYIVYVKNTFPLDLTLDGVRIVLDCASGAGYKVAPAVFEELGAEVILLGDRPNGFNINEKTGALFPEKTCNAVVKYRADVGISLDGDGDRVIMVDDKGQIVNGDHILAICGIHLAKKRALPDNTIVATHMSNVGLELALKEHGINLVRTDVGDKYVVEEMRNHGYTLGGEQSGHIISLEHSTTGDGCVAALHVLAVMLQEKKKLSDLTKLMKDVPQVLINTRVSVRKDLESIPGYRNMMDDINHKLEGSGRTYVRFSGTEPVVRVLVEGQNKKEIGQYAEQIASFLQKELG